MYDVYSKFDINKHAETFINYLEVCISPEGEVFYAVPSHQMFLENVLINKIGKERFYKIIEEPLAYQDYLVFLCNETGYISVWNDFYIKGLSPLTDKQKQKLLELSTIKYTKYPKSLYGGQI